MHEDMSKSASEITTFVSVFVSVTVKTSPFGLGVFAAQAIQRGQKILRFWGPAITFAEAVAKGHHQVDAMQTGTIDGMRMYIDLQEPGRTVNHSCDPNAGVTPQFFLVALRDIQAGEEIFYDYSTTMDEQYWEMPCRCQTALCRHVVRDFVTIPEERQQYYQQEGAASFMTCFVQDV